MKKVTQFFYTLALLFITIGAFAQDTICKINSTKQIVHILEKNDTYVRFKKFNDSDTSAYLISLASIFSINRKNSDQIEYINTIKTSTKLVKFDKRSLDYFDKFISINVGELILGKLNVNIEYILPRGKSSWQFGSTLNLNTSFKKLLGFNLGHYFYQAGQGTLKFFYGPSIDYGFIKFNNYEHGRGRFFKIQIKGGLIYQITKKINISINTGLGIEKSYIINEILPFSNRFYDTSENANELSLKFGIKF